MFRWFVLLTLIQGPIAFYSILELIFGILDTISCKRLMYKLAASLQLSLATIPIIAVSDLVLLKDTLHWNAV